MLLDLLNEKFLKDKFISYEEFLQEYLETNNVSKIEIVNTVLTGKQDAQSKKIVKAVVHPKDGTKVRKLLLGNVDHFLENLERLQLARGVSTSAMIKVDYVYKKDYKKLIM